MTYNEFIQNILDTRGRFGIPDGEYKERHHIVPKCLGGTNDQDNLIDLYAFEHYEAHKILAEENSGQCGLLYARFMMSHGGGSTNQRDFQTSEEYQLARESWVKWLRENSVGENNPNFGNHCLEGPNNPMYGVDRSGNNSFWFGKKRSPETISKWNRGNGKRIKQYSLDGDFIAEYESAADASRKTGVCCSGIKDSANGKWKTAGGYIWKHCNESDGLNRRANKVVVKCDMNWNEIEEYPSIAQAARSSKVNKQAISNCCNRRKGSLTAGGYKWRFKDEKGKQ